MRPLLHVGLMLLFIVIGLRINHRAEGMRAMPVSFADFAFGVCIVCACIWGATL